MSIFNYTAKDSSGNTVHGNVDARSREIALSLLKEQNLFVVNMSERKDSTLDQLFSFGKISTTDKVAFTRQFSTMISAGLPITRALEVLATQAENKRFRNIIMEILRAVEGGAPLSGALGLYPDVFNNTYRALVRAGESSGKLDSILKRLADNMEAERELNAKFKSAMIYPSVVFIAMIGVFIILMVFVIPKLADMYESLDVELPAITQIMISVSNFMVTYIWLIGILVAVAFFGLRYFLKSEEGRRMISEIMFRVPVFGNINKQKNYAQFSRTLSLLISSAVPIVDSINIVSTVVTNDTLKKAVLEAGRQVEKGNSLSSYFRSSKLFPPMLSQMSGVGEETGKMDEVLERVAVYYEGEVDHLVKGLSAALEPVILIMLGAMIGFLIVSIITPIYKITSAL